MTRHSFLVVSYALAASVAGCDCGGNDMTSMDLGPDVPGDPCVTNGGEDCFLLPSAVLVAHEPGGGSQDPDNSCVRSMSTTINAITLEGTTNDAASGAGVGPTTVSVFYAAGFSGTPDVSGPTDGAGAYSLMLPTPVPNEFDVLIQRTSAYDVRFFGAQIFFNPTTITGRIFPTVLRTTWSGRLTAIGEPVNASDGSLFGGAFDCDERMLEHAVVTVSSTSSAGDVPPTFVPGVRVYYVDGAAPVTRSARTETSMTGAFVVLGLDPGTQAYLQSWGFENATALGMGEAGLTLIGEDQIVTTADVLTTTALTPRSGP